MKIIILILIMVLFIKNSSENERNFIKLTNLVCTFNNDYIDKKSECRIKFDRQRRTILSIRANITKKIETPMITVDMYEKRTRYIPSFINTTFNGCDLLGGKTFNPFVKLLSKWVTGQFKTRISCPLLGFFELPNLYPDYGEVPSVFPAGDMLTITTIHQNSPTVALWTLKTYFTVFEN